MVKRCQTVGAALTAPAAADDEVDAETDEAAGVEAEDEAPLIA